MPAPATEMYRTRADAMATTAGSGPALLCAHGTLMDRTMFAPQIDALSDEFQVAAYDLRARTERCFDPYDLDDLVEDCRAVIAGLDLEKPVLAGMSMGGFMALKYALAYPETISGLVLIDSMAEPHADDDEELYRGMIEQVQDEPAAPRSLAETVTQFLFGETTRTENEDLVGTWVDRWATYPGESLYHEVNSWLDREPVIDDIASLEMPALVVHGEEDPSIAPEHGEAMAEALDARLELIPEAGHTSNLERPEPVNEAIRSFLETVY
jgi:pimeloyl-ACP methyl ester carboxylesterase